MAEGTVESFDDAKGYGFVSPAEGPDDSVVHHSNVNGAGFQSLRERAKVSFDDQAGPKGPEAARVTLAA